MKPLHTVFVVGAVSLTLLAGCNSDPVQDKPRAQVSEAAAVPESKTSGAVTLAFNEQGSKVAFVGAKVTGKHDGGFGKFSGTVAVSEGGVVSSVRAEIDTASLTTDTEQLTGHLKSPDFFDVARFPKAIFQSTQIVPASANGATHTVTGNLELHGVTKSISFPATLQSSPERVTVRSEFGINRKDFGIVYPGKPDDLIKDEVLIRLDVVATKP